jgi:hypothetical protein
MYFIILALMVASEGESALPIAMERYGTLKQCHQSLKDVSQLSAYDIYKSRDLGYVVQRGSTKEGTLTTLFCVRDVSSL